MAIRIRTVDGIRVAICAARSVEKPGDLYLDDGDHRALMDKCARDYAEMGIQPRGDPAVAPLVEQEESNNPAREWWDSVYRRQPMATIDLSGILKGIGEDIVASVRTVADSAVDLPDDIREKAKEWARDSAKALVTAGVCKVNNDGAGYDAALREIHLFRKAAEAIVTAQALTGLATAQIESRKRLQEGFALGVNIGLKVLTAAII